MAIVETLELRFRADMGALGAQLSDLAGRIAGLGTALSQGEAQLRTQAAALVQKVAEGLRDGAGMTAAPGAAGSLLAGQFARGIQGGTGQALLAAQALSAAARFSNTGAVSAARSAGAALGQGFANGISGKYGAVMAATNRIANAAVNRIRSALKIHSPSRVSWDLGAYFGEGFAQGVRGSIRMAEESAAALSTGAVDGLSARTALFASEGTEGLSGTVRAAMTEALGGTQIVIPLNVDGVKLGEASIRGINLVTRSAGRLMLEI